ncbi:MAG: glycosyltransferase [Candidatus Sulfotelmatobacter sp.]
MRLLQLGPYPPPHGGVQSNLVAIRTFLRRHGVPCAVINITRHRKPDSDEVYYPKSAAALIRLLLRLDYDVLHLHVGGMLSRRLLSLALACTLMRRSKTVMTFHSGGYPSSAEGKTTTRNSFAGYVLRRFDGLIGVNPEIISFFQRLGVDPKRTRLIYPHSFLPEENSAAALPEPLASFFSEHSPVLISVGLLEPEYDLALQIEVLGQVRQKFPSAGLLLIGSGSLEQELRGRIRACTYAEHILLCGDVPHAVTMTAISQANLMLRTTLFDGDAVSVREALHLGTPVIASDNGMRPAGVQLIPKSDLGALLHAIEDSLTQPPRRHADRGIDESNVQAVFDFYRELTGAKCG